MSKKAVSHEKNKYDAHTLPEVLSQIEELTGIEPSVAICDRGYRGISKIGNTEILIPKKPGKNATVYQKRKTRKRFRRRAGIKGNNRTLKVRIQACQELS